jgi:hypothetical protein
MIMSEICWLVATGSREYFEGSRMNIPSYTLVCFAAMGSLLLVVGGDGFGWSLEFERFGSEMA